MIMNDLQYPKARAFARLTPLLMTQSMNINKRVAANVSRNR
jgi:hypothetical protein